MPRVKGPWFPSFDRQQASTSDKKRYTFLPGAQSLRQVKRNLRNRCRNIIAKNDAESIAAFDRVLTAVIDEPDPEYAALHLFGAALTAHEDTGEPWHVCMTYIMDKFDEREQESAHVRPEESATEKGSRIGRLFRSFFPGRLRKSDEAAAEGNVDQQSGDGAAQHQTRDGRGGPQGAGEGAGTAASDSGQSLHAGR